MFSDNDAKRLQAKIYTAITVIREAMVDAEAISDDEPDNELLKSIIEDLDTATAGLYTTRANAAALSR